MICPTQVNGTAMSDNGHPHIEVRDGVPMIKGTRTKVIEVALDRLAHHWDADEIHRQHPHLSLPQIYSALAYYYDNKDELDKDIERRMARVDEIREKLEDPTVRLKIQARTRAS